MRPVVWYVSQGYAVEGGHEAHLMHFALEIRKRGFSPMLRVLDPLPAAGNRFLRTLQDERIPVLSLSDRYADDVERSVGLKLPAWRFIQSLRGHPADAELLRRHVRERMYPRMLRVLATEECPAVVHVLGRLPETLWPALPPGQTLMHHGTEGRRDATWDDSEWTAFRDFCNRAALNVAPGSGVAVNLRRDFSITADICTLYTICPDRTGGVPERGSPRRARRQFGILCRMTEEKGLRPLLDALRLLKDAGEEPDFVFAGAGSLLPELRAMADRYGLAGVTFVPQFDSPVDVLRDLDVFVHPSLSDAMPMAIAEALMCGLPCIATTVGGIPDLVRDGMEGQLVAPGNPAQLAEAIRRFAAMPDAEHSAFRAGARARYEDMCRPESVGRLLESFYVKIMSDQKEGQDAGRG